MVQQFLAHINHPSNKSKYKGLGKDIEEQPRPILEKYLADTNLHERDQHTYDIFRVEALVTAAFEELKICQALKEKDRSLKEKAFYFYRMKEYDLRAEVDQLVADRQRIFDAKKDLKHRADASTKEIDLLSGAKKSLTTLVNRLTSTSKPFKSRVSDAYAKISVSNVHPADKKAVADSTRAYERNVMSDAHHSAAAEKQRTGAGIEARAADQASMRRNEGSLEKQAIALRDIINLKRDEIKDIENTFFKDGVLSFVSEWQSVRAQYSNTYFQAIKKLLHAEQGARYLYSNISFSDLSDQMFDLEAMVILAENVLEHIAQAHAFSYMLDRAVSLRSIISNDQWLAFKNGEKVELTLNGSHFPTGNFVRVKGFAAQIVSKKEDFPLSISVQPPNQRISAVGQGGSPIQIAPFTYTCIGQTLRGIEPSFEEGEVFNISPIGKWGLHLVDPLNEEQSDALDDLRIFLAALIA